MDAYIGAAIDGKDAIAMVGSSGG
uniref:Uncharacterized protein n=1 Tax=mine drainage metagenome TaxID=410659 RepID=E6Q969_9ZZZZ